MRKIFFFLLMLPFCLHAQDKKADSLKRLIGLDKDPLKKASHYLLLYTHFSDSEVKSSKIYLDSANKLINHSPVDSLLLAVNGAYARYFDNTGQTDSAFRHIAIALKFATGPQNAAAKALLLNLKGNNFLARRDFSHAQAAYLEAMRIYSTLKNELAIANLYVNLGYLFQQQGLVKEAEKQYDEAGKYFKQTKNQDRLAQLYNNYGILYGESNQFVKASEYFEASTRIREKLPDVMALANSYMNVGGLAVLMKNYAKGRIFLLKAKTLFEKIDNLQGVNSCLTNLGDLEKEQQNYVQAEIYDKQSLALASKYQNMEDRENALHSIISLYEKIKNYKAANTYSDTLLILKDSIYKKSLTSQIAEMQTKYETGKKESQISLLNKENIIQKLSITNKNTTIGIIIAFFLVSLALGALYYNRYKTKQQARLQAEVIHQQDLAAKGIIEAEERERKRIARDLHDGVGQLFTTVKMNMEILVERYLLKQQDADILAEKTLALVDESCTEVRAIAHQMMPNALIKSGLVSALRDFINKIPADKLKISIETQGINDRLEISTETVLYRVIQESVNNVMKHAHATKLDILLLCDKQEITVSIEDNGRGFNTADQRKFTGIGLKNMVSRIEYLKGTVDISSAPGKGTLVAIYIPLA